MALPAGCQARQLAPGRSRPSTSRPGSRTPSSSSVPRPRRRPRPAPPRRVEDGQRPQARPRAAGRVSLTPGTVRHRSPLLDLDQVAAEPGPVLVDDADGPGRVVGRGREEDAGDLVLGDPRLARPRPGRRTPSWRGRNRSTWPGTVEPSVELDSQARRPASGGGSPSQRPTRSRSSRRSPGLFGQQDAAAGPGAAPPATFRSASGSPSAEKTRSRPRSWSR